MRLCSTTRALGTFAAATALLLGPTALAASVTGSLTISGTMPSVSLTLEQASSGQPTTSAVLDGFYSGGAFHSGVTAVTNNVFSTVVDTVNSSYTLSFQQGSGTVPTVDLTGSGGTYYPSLVYLAPGSWAWNGCPGAPLPSGSTVVSNAEWPLAGSTTCSGTASGFGVGWPGGDFASASGYTYPQLTIPASSGTLTWSVAFDPCSASSATAPSCSANSMTGTTDFAGTLTVAVQ